MLYFLGIFKYKYWLMLMLAWDRLSVITVLDVPCCRPCNLNRLLHIMHVTHCLASEICHWDEASAAWVSHVTLRKIVGAWCEKRVWCLSCDTHLQSDTSPGGAASRTADSHSGVMFNVAAYVVIGVVMLEGHNEQKKDLLFSSYTPDTLLGTSRKY